MSTSFSRNPEMTGHHRTERWVHGFSGLGTAKKWLETALRDLEKRRAEPEVEQEANS
jgi:hypothetical protein